MPTEGDAIAAARAALSRGDVRLLIYWQNGEAAHDVTPGVRWARNAKVTDAMRANYEIDDKASSRCTRAIQIEIDEAKSPGCCDIPWTPTTCGEKQQNYAETYNLEVIRAPAFIAACGRYDPAPGLRNS